MKKLLILLALVLLLGGCGSKYGMNSEEEVLSMRKECWERNLDDKEIIDGWGSVIDIKCITPAIEIEITEIEIEIEEKISQLDDEELFDLWWKMPSGGNISLNLYRKLDERGYWDKENEKREKEAEELLQELLNN